jgi:DNA-binding SARP family transcriptional activator
LAYLAVQDRPIHRLKLAAIFWPDATDRQSLANLRSALWRLVGSSHDVLDVGTRSIALKRAVQVDLREATSLARSLVDKRSAVTEEQLTTASSFLRDDLLPGWYDDWVVQHFERWRQLRLHGLEALAQRLIADGRFVAALDAALLCVEADPLRETAHAEVIKTHLAEHNQSEAIRAFDLCCSILHRELGLEPSRNLRSLVAPHAQ